MRGSSWARSGQLSIHKDSLVHRGAIRGSARGDRRVRGVPITPIKGGNPAKNNLLSSKPERSEIIVSYDKIAAEHSLLVV